MKRREHLQTLGRSLLAPAALAGCAAASAGASASPAGAAQRERVLVIGAGLAGLAAAQQLQQQGREVQVLEARDRIGGRIWTSDAWPDLPLDLGASWIHGTRGNPLSALADAVGAARVATSYERVVTFDTEGEPLTAAQRARLDHWEARVQALLKAAQRRDPDVSVLAAVQPLLAPLDADSEDARLIRFVLSATIEQEYAGSAARLSAHWYDSAESMAGEDVLFAQGFRSLLAPLARGLDIHTGVVVQEVHWQATPPRVITTAGRFEADRIVLTLPLGVLQAGSVRFVPELPAAKRQAIAALGMGVLNKCYLRFPEVFWDEEADWLEHVSERPGEWTEWVSLQRALRQPVLLGFNAADRGRAIESLSDAQTVHSAMQTLRTLYGNDIPQPSSWQITRWASDPFARGSYSFSALGSTPQSRRELAAPLAGRLFFAGEATGSPHHGTAHAALLSGQRAARELLNA